jgi:hypothetical protein
MCVELEYTLLKATGKLRKSTGKRRRSKSTEAEDTDTPHKKSSRISQDEYKELRKQQHSEERQKKKEQSSSGTTNVIDDDDDIKIVTMEKIQSVTFDPMDLKNVPGFHDVMATIRQTQSTIEKVDQIEEDYSNKIQQIRSEAFIIPEDLEPEPPPKSPPKTTVTASTSEPPPPPTEERGEKVNIRLRFGPNDELTIKFSKNDPFSKLYNWVSKQKNTSVAKISLLFDNMKLQMTETMEDQDMEDGEIIDVKITN